MSLIDDAQRLYDEYMDEDNEKADEAAMHYAELHPKILAAMELLAEFVDYSNWMHGEWHGPRSASDARKIVGLDPPDDDDD